MSEWLDNTSKPSSNIRQLLYADDDHLSVIGSEWQFNKIIKPIYEKNLVFSH